MLGIVCWLWHNPDGRRWGVYKAHHVNALARMLKEHMSIPYKLTCITDSPEMDVECDTYQLWDFPRIDDKIDAYRRLKLFDPETGKQFGERVVSIDLDVLIEADLAPLFDNDNDFQGIKGRASWINGSLWSLKVGTNLHVWDEFDPDTVKKLISKSKFHGSDQAWMSMKMPKCAYWNGNDDGAWLYKDIRQKTTFPEFRRITVFPGGVNPWENSEFSQGFQILHKNYMKYL